MRGDALVNRQRLMAAAVSAIANHVQLSTGYQLTPVKFAELPEPSPGLIACISDGQVSGATNWGNVVGGGGTEILLVWYNGTNWTVFGK